MFILSWFLEGCNEGINVCVCVSSPCSSKNGQQMIYLPLLLVDELSFRARDLMVGLFYTNPPPPPRKGLFCLNWIDCKFNICPPTDPFTGDQQQHGPAPSDCVLRGNELKEVPVLGASAGRGVFPATVRWADKTVFLSRALRRSNLTPAMLRLCFSRLHRGVHRWDQRNVGWLQPLPANVDGTHHSCASKVMKHHNIHNFSTSWTWTVDCLPVWVNPQQAQVMAILSRQVSKGVALRDRVSETIAIASIPPATLYI